MVDPFTAAAAFLVAAGAGKKVLGPTLDKMGEELVGVAGPRIENFGRIVERALDRGGAIAEGESVHPRIVSEVLENGSWFDDDVAQEYLAGLLVSARSVHSDDRGFQYTRLVTSLTAQQLRIHHAFYAAFARSAPPLDWHHGANLAAQHVWAPLEDFATFLTPASDEELDVVVFDACNSLIRASLLAGMLSGWSDDLGANLRDRCSVEPAMARPTYMGIILFLWAYGIRTVDANRIRDIDWGQFPSIGPMFSRHTMAPISGDHQLL